MNLNELKNKLLGGELDDELLRVYEVADEIPAQRERIGGLLELFEGSFGNADGIGIFSAPGRTEIGGNHTDHNRGRVLAAAINLDAVAAAAPNGTTSINFVSLGHEIAPVDVRECDKAPEEEKGTSTALIRGVCAGFLRNGYQVGGFNAAAVSDVLAGSGLSSSASFEVLVGTVLNHLFNGGQISAVEIAKISQYAENNYFGKPCGLMDQTACSVGGFVTIDFKNPNEPVIEKINYDFAHCGHSLCIVNTGGSHMDLTDEYAAVRREMEAAASVLGCTVLRETSKDKLLENLDAVRGEAGDRAVLRALHFFGDNARVLREVDALNGGNFEAFKNEVIKSGYSSFMYNQNISVSGEKKSQPVALGLALCEDMLDGCGAWRVHGGGFAGTIQAFVPNGKLNDFKSEIEAVFGEGSCYVLLIRQAGGTKII